MNRLAQAVATTSRTENGAVTFSTSLSSAVDLFFTIGARRGLSVEKELNAALHEDPVLTAKILMWSRDVRGGAGERQHFRDNLVEVLNQLSADQASNVIRKIPEIGRFDDLKVLFGTFYQDTAVAVWLDALREGNGLAAKWAPRKDKKGAAPLRKALGMSEAQWRKYVVGLTNVVEQDMCAKQWHNINYSHVPSRAMQIYRKAFFRNDKSRMEAYVESLSDPEANTKVNAGAIFPHTCVAPFTINYWLRENNLTASEKKLLEEQWKALPDYMEGSEVKSILPLVDVSGSMYGPDESSPINVAIGLGMYLAERNKGSFKDVICTFSHNPDLFQIPEGSLAQKVRAVAKTKWGLNTDFNKVFSLILDTAIRDNLDQEDLPSTVLVLSDMEFDCCGSRKTNFESIKAMYAEHGYAMPKIVFWNIESRNRATPVRFNESGTALISGFSPAIMKSVLQGVTTPYAVMLQTVDVDRYAI
jgi:hypothetical protein